MIFSHLTKWRHLWMQREIRSSKDDRQKPKSIPENVTQHGKTFFKSIFKTFHGWCILIELLSVLLELYHWFPQNFDRSCPFPSDRIFINQSLSSSKHLLCQVQRLRTSVVCNYSFEQRIKTCNGHSTYSTFSNEHKRLMRTAHRLWKVGENKKSRDLSELKTFRAIFAPAMSRKSIIKSESVFLKEHVLFFHF